MKLEWSEVKANLSERRVGRAFIGKVRKEWQRGGVDYLIEKKIYESMCQARKKKGS